MAPAQDFRTPPVGAVAGQPTPRWVPGRVRRRVAGGGGYPVAQNRASAGQGLAAWERRLHGRVAEGQAEEVAGYLAMAGTSTGPVAAPILGPVAEV